MGLDLGDMVGHIPLPASSPRGRQAAARTITIRVLEPIDLRRRFGPEPDFDVVYGAILGQMQDELTRLASRRRLPVLG